MIEPRQIAFFIPPNLKKFKLALFERIAEHIKKQGGRVVRHDYRTLEQHVPEFVPVVGCSPPLALAIKRWQAEGSRWIYWDRGYLRRVFATWLPRGSDMGLPGGFYRWQLGSFQMQEIREVPGDRLQFLKLDQPWYVGGEKMPALPHAWHMSGDHILIADTLADYWDLRGLPRNWSHRMAIELKKYTTRSIVVRDKESKKPLHEDLRGAHALVTHGSIAAVEAITLGYPVFVDASSAAAMMGRTDFSRIEDPIYPDNREQWLRSLAYAQFHENELCDGTLWRLLQ